ncbi:hypothetical protein TYRP_013282 [Tyrophagus putrescentiae]|nr:hypothetical protein TYRP_013282 [Tyrophagus putrescentiae]
MPKKENIETTECFETKLHLRQLITLKDFAVISTAHLAARVSTPTAQADDVDAVGGAVHTDAGRRVELADVGGVAEDGEDLLRRVGVVAGGLHCAVVLVGADDVAEAVAAEKVADSLVAGDEANVAHRVGHKVPLDGRFIFLLLSSLTIGFQCSVVRQPIHLLGRCLHLLHITGNKQPTTIVVGSSKPFGNFLIEIGQRAQIFGDAAVDDEDCAVDEGGVGQLAESGVQQSPDVLAHLSAKLEAALLQKEGPIHPGHLVVASQHSEVRRVHQLEQNQEAQLVDDVSRRVALLGAVDRGAAVQLVLLVLIKGALKNGQHSTGYGQGPSGSC